MNFITGLSLYHHKETVYDAYMMIVNHYIKITKYILTIKTINLMKLANELENNIIQNFSMLKSIVSDRESVFTSRV